MRLMTKAQQRVACKRFYLGRVSLLPEATPASGSFRQSRRRDRSSLLRLFALINPNTRRRGDRAALRRVRTRSTCDGVIIYFGYPQAHEDDAERRTRVE